MKEDEFNQNKCWGGRRECAGRKKTCRRKIPFNRRIIEDVLNILKEYAQNHNMTETEALESAIILQSNIEKLKYVFDSNGKLLSITNKHNNKLKITYDGNEISTIETFSK